MNTTLAIYEALIEADVPPPAVRRAAEALEADMLTHLATKQDLAHLEQRVNARVDSLETQLGQRIDALDQRLSPRIKTVDQHLDQRIEALDQSISARCAASHTQYDLKLQDLESRLVIKLGALLTVLLSAASALQVLLR
jgi:exonuclease VII large subunit